MATVVFSLLAARASQCCVLNAQIASKRVGAKRTITDVQTLSQAHLRRRVHKRTTRVCVLIRHAGHFGTQVANI